MREEEAEKKLSDQKENQHTQATDDVCTRSWIETMQEALNFLKGKCLSHNLVPRAFLHRGEGGREKTLASVDHVIFNHPEKLGLISFF